jgi:hypothetical protein
MLRLTSACCPVLLPPDPELHVTVLGHWLHPGPQHWWPGQCPLQHMGPPAWLCTRRTAADQVTPMCLLHTAGAVGLSYTA